MTEFTIVLGNKAYSSWSLRGWLMLQQSGAAFDEVVVRMDRPDYKAEILAHSPSGRVPALLADGVTVWDTLAIAEFLHERFPRAGLWPEDPAARALARSVAAEMHAGFATLREHLPMNLKRRPKALGARAPEEPLAADISRILDIWGDCRRRYGDGGDFLFGAFGAADAFYAPVVTRFVTYGIVLEGATADYRDAIMAWPDLRAWIADAKAEPLTIQTP